MTTTQDDKDRTYQEATEAWQRLKKGNDWSDWLQIGAAIVLARAEAMKEAGTNKPQGKKYTTAFGEWLAAHKLDDMDKGDRARLFELMENRAAIEAWRATLDDTAARRLNHPHAVLRSWKAKSKVPDTKKDKKPGLREANVTLSEEKHALEKKVADLTAHVQELEAAQPAAEGHEADEAEAHQSEAQDTELPRIEALKGLTIGQLVPLLNGAFDVAEVAAALFDGITKEQLQLFALKVRRKKVAVELAVSVVKQLGLAQRGKFNARIDADEVSPDDSPPIAPAAPADTPPRKRRPRLHA